MTGIGIGMGAGDEEEEMIRLRKRREERRHATLNMEWEMYAQTPLPLRVAAQAAAGVMLQAVVTLGEKTDEGHLIEAVAPAWFEIARLIRADPKAMHQIDPRKWEEMIAAWYKQYGFDEVILTPRSGDLGRDVIAVKRGVLSVRILDQVKAYSPGHVVPANDVRALAGVLALDRSASKGLVTTTSDFAPGVHTEFASMIPTRLELVNGAELNRRLIEVASKQPHG